MSISFADEEAEAATRGAKKPCLVHVDSGAIDTLTDGDSSGSEDSFLPDDASAADISIHDPGAALWAKNPSPSLSLNISRARHLLAMISGTTC